MSFLQKIYFNDSPLVITTNRDGFINTYPEAKSYLSYHGSSQQTFTEAIRKLVEQRTPGVIIEETSANAILQQLRATFVPITAGGGLVYNEKGEVLIIFRRGKWDLPKGKLDPGETIEDCALREVSEETGLRQLVLGNKLCDTYHVYTQKKEHILKHSAWYKMSGTSSDTLQPQTEEGIMDARWVHPKDVSSYAASAYAAVRDVLRAAVILP